LKKIINQAKLDFMYFQIFYINYLEMVKFLYF